ncbi:MULTISPECIES: hypothetical protein [unclassified Vibrio]|uniref:hypothetical protein n=1 Tax=unclassified Vibrio TaxID=2614977 RepID=UPI0029650B7F|nr:MULTISPECIES: hypothetical protein [unclassified Vibrio]MDW1584374.1 hypothetical protein [Vibrio sp. Vb2897]MDW1642695.1 hypothetical protein [Vibrio sp. Vb2896]
MKPIYTEICFSSGVLIDGFRTALKFFDSQKSIDSLVEVWHDKKNWDISLNQFAEEYRAIEKHGDDYAELSNDNSQDIDDLEGYFRASEWYEKVLEKYREQAKALNVTTHRINCYIFNKEYHESDDPELKKKNSFLTINDLLNGLDYPQDVIENMKRDFVIKYLKENSSL